MNCALGGRHHVQDNSAYRRVSGLAIDLVEYLGQGERHVLLLSINVLHAMGNKSDCNAWVRSTERYDVTLNHADGITVAANQLEHDPGARHGGEGGVSDLASHLHHLKYVADGIFVGDNAYD